MEFSKEEYVSFKLKISDRITYKELYDFLEKQSNIQIINKEQQNIFLNKEQILKYSDAGSFNKVAK